MTIKCKIKQAEHARKHYENNKAKVKRRAEEWTAQNRNRNHELIKRYKLLCGCKLCGYRKYHKALEFHHKGDDKKELAVAEMLHRGRSLIKLKAEISKCIVVCANCYREIHADEASAN